MEEKKNNSLGHKSEKRKKWVLIKTAMFDFIGGTKVAGDARQISACSHL